MQILEIHSRLLCCTFSVFSSQYFSVFITFDVWAELSKYWMFISISLLLCFDDICLDGWNVGVYMVFELLDLVLLSLWSVYRWTLLFSSHKSIFLAYFIALSGSALSSWHAKLLNIPHISYFCHQKREKSVQSKLLNTSEEFCNLLSLAAFSWKYKFFWRSTSSLWKQQYEKDIERKANKVGECKISSCSSLSFFSFRKKKLESCEIAQDNFLHSTVKKSDERNLSKV